jgi:tripartite-type tricarboxylate transporter receptor subunit TctC
VKAIIYCVLIYLAVGAAPAIAQADYPKLPVTIVAPATPGGFYSLIGRMIGDRLRERLGVPFVVEHKPGSGTALGARYVARATPDGYTLLIAATATLAVQPAIMKKPLYDSNSDFSPIAMISDSQTVLVANASLGIGSIADLVKAAKKSPNKLTFASNGPGSVLHLSGEVLQRQLDIQLTHIPYKGAVPAITDVAAGHVSMMFTPLDVAESLIDAGKLRVVGVASKQRIAALPHVPTLDESGAPGYNVSGWFMLVAPANTPATIVDLLHREIRTWTDLPETQQELLKRGSLPVTSPSPALLKAFLADEVVRWRQVVENAGLARSE